MTPYLLYVAFAIFWILGIYLVFNRKKIRTKITTENEMQYDIIAQPTVSKIRVIFDQCEPDNLDIKSLADLTVKYSELISGSFKLPKKTENEMGKEDLTEKGKEEIEDNQEPEKTEKIDLSEYVNIFSIKNNNNQ